MEKPKEVTSLGLLKFKWQCAYLLSSRLPLGVLYGQPDEAGCEGSADLGSAGALGSEDGASVGLASAGASALGSLA